MRPWPLWVVKRCKRVYRLPTKVAMLPCLRSHLVRPIQRNYKTKRMPNFMNQPIRLLWTEWKTIHQKLNWFETGNLSTYTLCHKIETYSDWVLQCTCYTEGAAFWLPLFKIRVWTHFEMLKKLQKYIRAYYVLKKSFHEKPTLLWAR